MFGSLRRADKETMDTSPAPLDLTTPAPLTKIPSLTKPASVKALKPTAKSSIKPRTTRFRSKHDRMMDKRHEERLEKYKVSFFAFLGVLLIKIVCNEFVLNYVLNYN